MADWVTGKYAIKGEEKNILDFLNTGLKNSGVSEETSIKGAIEKLLVCAVSPNVANVYDGNNVESVSNELSMATFRPADPSYYRFDTTNEPRPRSEFSSDEYYRQYIEGYNKEKGYQKKTYGEVGWWDANINLYYGCKWGSGIDELTYGKTTDGEPIVWLSIMTPWSVPALWLEWIAKTFNLTVCFCVSEESGMFNYFGYYEQGTGDEITVDDREFEKNQYDIDDFDDKDDYFIACDNLISEMFKDFEYYVLNNKIE